VYAEILEAFAKKFNHHVSLSGLVQEAADAIVTACSAPLAVALFRDTAGNSYFSFAGTLSSKAIFVRERIEEWIIEEPICGPVDMMGYFGEGLSELGIQSITAMPVNVHREVSGILIGFSREATPPDREILRLLAIQAGLAARSCWLHRQGSNMVDQFQQARHSLMVNEERLKWILHIQRKFTDPKLWADGFDQLVGILGDVLKGPILLMDRVLRVLASYTPPVSLEGAWVRSLEERRLDPELANRPTLQNTLRRLLTREASMLPVETAADWDGGVYWLASLCSGNNVWGFLLWRGEQPPLVEEKQYALQLAGSALTLAFFQQLQSPVQQRPSFLESFLAGRYISTEAVMEQARREGCDLGNVSRLVVVEPELQNLSVADILMMVEGAVAGYGFGTYAAVYADSIVLLLESEVDAKRLAHFVLERLLMNNVSAIIGVSRSFRDLDDIRFGYDELKRSLALARKLGKKDTVVVYDELGVYRILISLDKSLLEEIVHQALGPLLRQEQTQTAELLSTLTYYIRSGGSLQQTAEQCFIHLNTVKYRLKRIAQLLGTDLTSPEDRFQLDFALRALEIRDL
jgi:hypothetical protein